MFFVILTTSRKPSRRTRSLAKALARFMNWRYVTRGKLSLEDLYSMLGKNEHLAIIEEVKGNPAILKIVHPEKGLILFIRFNVSNVVKVKMDDSPVVFIGKAPFDPLILGALPQSEAGLKLARKIDSKKKVFVKRDDDWIVLEFRYEDTTVFKMKIKKRGGIKSGS
jgi:U3 small nucleolar ribonucleoprotein protein IMP4